MNKIYPLTNKRKKKIYAKIFPIKEEVFNVKYLKDSLKNIENIEELDILKLLNKEENKYFDCMFINKSFAWISKDINGKYRYFSKGYITYSLDIYDLLSLFFNCKFSKIFININKFEPNNKINNKFMKNIKNAETNINIIKNIYNENFNELLKDKIDIYMALNDFCKCNLIAEKQYKENNVFFISIRYLKEKYQLPYSISTINQVINLYSWLGIINKVPYDSINSELSDSFIKKSIKNNKVPISFYSMPLLMSDNSLELNCKVLIDNELKYYNIKKNNSFVAQEYNMITVYNENKGGGQKTNRAKECAKQKHTLEESFETMMYEYGFVLKEYIIDNFDMSMATINKKWKLLISQYNAKSIKPTKKIKEKFNLKTNQDIAIKSGLKILDLLNSDFGKFVHN